MRKTLFFLAALLHCLPLMAQQTNEVKRANHYLDHLVLGINDFDKGVEEVRERTGVRPKFDGRDPQLGTQSAVIALGEKSFLEIIGPDPKANPEEIDAGLKPMILDRLATMDELTPFKWAIGTSNLDRTIWFARRAGSQPAPVTDGTRKRSWGRRVDWTWTWVHRPVSRVMPLFVQWDEDTNPPQERAPGDCKLAPLNIYTRNFKSVHTLVASMQIAAEVEGAEEDALGFTLECPAGEVVFEPVSLMHDDQPRRRTPVK